VASWWLPDEAVFIEEVPTKTFPDRFADHALPERQG